jgi:hypothetical protein
MPLPHAPRTSSLPPKVPQTKKWNVSELTAQLYEISIKATPPLWSDEESEEDVIVVEEEKPKLANRLSFPDIDSEKVHMLLDQLNKENAMLALNPKSVIASNGSIQMRPATLQSLTSFYSNHAPVIQDDPSFIEFWNHFLLYDPVGQIHRMPHLIIAKTRSGPIPPHLRAQVWGRLCCVETDPLIDLYQKMNSMSSPAERLIERDIGRTFPQSDMFKDEGGPGQQSLFRILKAYSLFDTEVGYCQGLSFCVGPLLMQKVFYIDQDVRG